MKKILILAMSCNQPFFKRQADLIRETYAKDIIEGKYGDHIDFWIYTASPDDKYHINVSEKTLYVPANDTLHGTYEKTIKVLKLISTKSKFSFIDYDYIFRTNCSTYINVKPLDMFVQNLDNDRIIYSGAVYSTKDASGPYEYCMYGVGNSLLIPRYWVNIICENHISKYADMIKVKSDSIYNIDDNAIGTVVNCYAIQNGMNHLDIWKNFNLPYINTIPADKDLNKYIAVPFRIYGGNREHEFQLCTHIHNYIKNNELVYNLHEISGEQQITIINFGKGIRTVKKRDDGIQFIKTQQKL